MSVSGPRVVREEAGGAVREQVVAALLGGEREHRQVARARIALEPAERLGLLVVAEAEQDHVGAVLLGERERRRRAHGHEALEARRAGDVEPGGGAVDVGVGDQHDAIALGDLLAVVAERVAARGSAGAGSVVLVRRLGFGSACSGCGGRSVGSSSVNVEPSPSAEDTRISPPSRRAISRLIESPRPVPP